MSANDSHGGTKLYWVFCIILCVVTFLEWLIFDKRVEYGVSNTMLVGSLTIMSLTKFVMVVGWYMHLRYDPPIMKQMFIVSMAMITATACGIMYLMA